MKFEYKIHRTSDNQFEMHCNPLGSDGWELVTIARDGNTGLIVAFFKRAIASVLLD